MERGAWLALGLAWAACDSSHGDVVDATRDDAHDTTTGDVPVGGCFINWRPLADADVGTRVRVTAGDMLMRTDGQGPVEVRALVGAAPLQGASFLLRLDVGRLTLGPDGSFRVVMTAPEGPVATLVVNAQGAVLTVESFPVSNSVEVAFAKPPTRLVLELESRVNLKLAAHAFFFEASSRVLETEVDRFAGGLVTAGLTLSGSSAELALDRMANVSDNGGGPLDDFLCDSVGLDFDREQWPEDRPSKNGQACSGDIECGAGERCIDDICRHVCLSSSECVHSICLVRGNDIGVCRLAAESSCNALPPGLVCGPDGTARLPCGGPVTCAHASDLCIGGACVSNDEDSAAADPWGTCPTGDGRCRNDDVEVCDQGGPGWNKVDTCDHGDCVVDGTTARCDACERTCVAGDVFAACGSPHPMLEVDCVDGAEACSTGDDNRETAHCRPLIAASEPIAAVSVGPPAVTIDATEVTRAAYLGFLKTNPRVSEQPPECAGNLTFMPGDFPWFAAPLRAVQVDFCDAQAYCRYAGKTLCPTPAWYAACSANGTLAYPYGNTFEAGVCSNDTKRDIATSPGCTTTVVGYTGVWDMVGGVGEWLDACEAGSGAQPNGDTCHTRGSLPPEPCTSERAVRRDSMAGIRCCTPP